MNHLATKCDNYAAKLFRTSYEHLITIHSVKTMDHKVPSKTQELTYELKVEQVMSKNVTTLKPDSTMNEVRKILRNNKISGIPIVEGDRVVGIITVEDLVICLLELKPGGIDEKVKNRMTKNVVTVYSDEPIVQIFGKFEKTGFGRFPVVDREKNKLTELNTFRNQTRNDSGSSTSECCLE